MAEISNYKVAAAPHRLDSSNTRKIMLDVLIALLPCLICGVVFFGLYSLLLVVICAATCFVSEQIYNLIRKKPLTFDLSALVTGIILGLNLPPRAPWYIPVIGGVFAIIVVKMLFGGLGKNFANPAATARVFLLLAYSSLMTQYIGADISGNLLSTDAVTAPTYLGGGISALQGSFLGISETIPAKSGRNSRRGLATISRNPLSGERHDHEAHRPGAVPRTRRGGDATRRCGARTSRWQSRAGRRSRGIVDVASRGAPAHGCPPVAPGCCRRRWRSSGRSISSFSMRRSGRRNCMACSKSASGISSRTRCWSSRGCGRAGRCGTSGSG